MKHLILYLLILVSTSCRIRQYSEEFSEITEGVSDTTFVKQTPCRNKIYCDANLSQMYEDYPLLDVFLVKSKNVDLDYIFVTKYRSPVDTSNTIILDRLQFNCTW